MSKLTSIVEEDGIAGDDLTEDAEYLSTQLITYIGNKRSLLDFIDIPFKEIVKKYDRKLNILDGFSGSGAVARFLKRYANVLHTNDLEIYSTVINRCYLSDNVDISELSKIVTSADDYVSNNLESGFITKLYSPKDDANIVSGERAFYTKRNAKYIDTMRKYIDSHIPKKYRNYLLASLLSEASIHTNTSGVFKGFYKNKNGIGQFGGENKDSLSRITGDIHIKLPIFSKYKCETICHNKDTNVLVKSLNDLDVAYFDPPYNQHPYSSNYFMLSLIATYIEPTEISDVSGIPSNWNRSNYNKKIKVLSSLRELVENCSANYILFSYNSEGFVSKNEFENMLKDYGNVKIYNKEYSAFKGSRNLASRSSTVDEIIFSLQKV